MLTKKDEKRKIIYFVNFFGSRLEISYFYKLWQLEHQF